MGSTPLWAVLFIGGSTESICCGSFHRKKRLNGSIPRSSRENQAGIFVSKSQLRPKSEFRSLAEKKYHVVLMANHFASPHVTLI
jgi:hypothetical protein